MTLRAFQCFRAGMHTPTSGASVTFTGSDLAQMATSYDVTKRRAPLVLGHPENDAPQYGGVRALIAHDDALFAVAEVSDSLLRLVRDGRYRYVSSSIMKPGHADNPVNSGYYLKHIGFLGAVAPAVTGMQPLAFAEALPLTFEFSAPLVSVSGRVSRSREALHRDALVFQKAHPHLSYIQAAQHLEQLDSASAFSDAHGGVDARRMAIHRAAQNMCIANPSLTYIEAAKHAERSMSASFRTAANGSCEALYCAALELQNLIPSLTFNEAAARVERALA
ncbi:hypothetical protein [Rhodanobacter lindaniclasticus]